MLADIVWMTVLFGAIASASSALALRASRRLKQEDGDRAAALTLFWGSVTAYMVSFTLLRIAHALDASELLLSAIYVLQTLTGASTIISLASIMFGVLLPAKKRRIAVNVFLGLAAINVTLILALGFQVVARDHWGIEFLPNSIAARVMVALVYMLMPLAMATMVSMVVRRFPADVRHRFILFSTSVVLMYLPNAVKYVAVFSGPVNAALAGIMMVGAYLGWRAYIRTSPPSSASNG